MIAARARDMDRVRATVMGHNSAPETGPNEEDTSKGVDAVEGRVTPRLWGPSGLTAFLVVVASAAVRVWNLRAPAVQIDGDQAVTGIMVQRMLRGDNFYVFVAGQRYNGALEQWAQVGVYRVTGLGQDPFTLRLPEVVWMAAATWLVYAVGRRVLLKEWPAVFAAALFSVGPYWSFWKGNHSDGAYPSLIVIGLVGVWCAMRFDPVKSSKYWWTAGFGVCGGLIMWLGQSGVWLLVPAALWLAPSFARSLRLWPVAFACAVIGAAPSLMWSWQNGIFAPFDIGLSTVPTTLQQRVHNVLGPLLREFVGVAGDEGTPGWPYWLQHLTIAALVAVIAVGAVRRRRGLSAIVTLSADTDRRPVDALLVSVPIVLGVYVLSKSSWDTANPHYLFTFTPVLVWLLAAALPTRRPTLLLPTAAVVGFVFTTTSLMFVVNRAPTYPGTSDADLHAAIAYLDEHHQTAAYADFWTGMPTMYFADGNVAVAPIGAGRGKFPATDRAVDTAASFVYLDSARNDSGRIVNPRPPIRQQLLAYGVTFTETHFGTVTVFSNLGQPLRPWELGLGPEPTPNRP